MSRFEMCICDFCGKELYKNEAQYHRMYTLPYFIDNDLNVTTDPHTNMNLCEDCAIKIRDFCKTLDSVNGYMYEGDANLKEHLCYDNN